MKHRLMYSVALVALSACGEVARPVDVPLSSLQVRTDRTEYRPLELIFVTTTNQTARPIYDDHCAGAVQGSQSPRQWSASYGTVRGGCYWPEESRWREYSVVIPPGAVHVDTFHVNSLAYAGTWRVELRLRDDAGKVLSESQRISNTFRVQVP